MDRLLERILLASRWILVVFYLGLVVALGLYAVSFMGKLYKMAASVTSATDVEMILAMLGLMDAALVAGLVVMVIITSYENFIGKFSSGDGESLAWAAKLDSVGLKSKMASAIVAISSIQLLQVFLNMNLYSSEIILWMTVIHVVFVISALVMAHLGKLGK